MSGSILWGILFRAVAVILLTLFVVVHLGYRQLWYASIFVFWLVVVWPAWRQWQRFEQNMEQIAEDTLCGKCQHFVPESQLCTIHDQHIAEPVTLPCNGFDFEMKQEG